MRQELKGLRKILLSHAAHILTEKGYECELHDDYIKIGYWKRLPHPVIQELRLTESEMYDPDTGLLYAYVIELDINKI